MDEDKELSNRERQICLLFLEGFGSVEIAEMLGIAKGTLKKHKNNIKGKLDANNDVIMGFRLANVFSRGDVKGAYLEHLTIFKPEGKDS